MEQSIILSLSFNELKDLIKNSVSEALTLKSKEGIQDPSSDELINIEDIQKIFNVSKVTVHKWKKKGLIPYYKMNRKVYFKKSEVINAMSHKKRKMEI